jgi:drug/metabolite transporter (DMT)-like permease
MCLLLLAQFFVCTFFGVDYLSSAISSYMKSAAPVAA